MPLSAPLRILIPGLLLAALLLSARAVQPRSPGLEIGSFTTELNGHPLHYEVRGSGPVLMTVPNSWGLGLGGIRALFAPLEEHFTVVYFDPRGIGGSGESSEPKDLGPAAVREDFHALHEHLRLGSVHAIGWSNGAMNLLRMAAEDLQVFRSTIYVHGVASLTQEDARSMAESRPEFFAKVGGYVQAQMAPERSDAERDAAHREFFMSSYLAGLFADEAAGRRFLADEFEDVELSWDHWLATQQEMPTFDERDRLAGIDVPSLVIAGAHDLALPEKVRELHEGLPDSEFLLLERSGHFGPVEEAERFVQAVVAFVGRVESVGR